MEPALLAFDVAAKEHQFVDELGESGKVENSPPKLRSFFLVRFSWLVLTVPVSGEAARSLRRLDRPRK